jgi:hypothetical protein
MRINVSEELSVSIVSTEDNFSLLVLNMNHMSCLGTTTTCQKIEYSVRSRLGSGVA